MTTEEIRAREEAVNSIWTSSYFGKKAQVLFRRCLSDIPFLISENERLQQQLDAAVELIDEIRNDDTGDIGYIFFKIDKWRGAERSE